MTKYQAINDNERSCNVNLTNCSKHGEYYADDDDKNTRETTFIENCDENLSDTVGAAVDIIPESKAPLWNHIEDLDSFFTKIYHYHQKHGLLCIMLEEILELVLIMFVICFPTFIYHCVDYPILFKDKLPKNHNKTTITDAFLPFDECVADMHTMTWIFISAGSIFWILRFIKVFHCFVQYVNIKHFFKDGLKINDNELDNLTWLDIQMKIMEIQKEHAICVHKKELTELDICNRILRFKNYMIALINKSLLPIQLKVPFMGNFTVLTHGLKLNYELILFWGPWSPFVNNWHLREEYKQANKRNELAKSLSKHILCVGLINFILCPVIFLFQVLYLVFNYGEIVKREPSALGIRKWSLFARFYLRHFNELDHEFDARLTRAYRPAVKYLDNFTSPLVNIIAQKIAFIFGSIFIVLLLLTFYDEDLLSVQHVLLIMSITGGTAALCRSMIPDENLVRCPETLLNATVAYIHYRPDGWKNKAHTQAVRAEMAQLLQYSAAYWLQELLSPLITPYMLCFHLRYRALDIVDFFRNFTINLSGVGDVCSYAQMNLSKHGKPSWESVVQSTSVKNILAEQEEETELAVLHEHIPILSNNQAKNEKVELSLIHFALANPQWKPPPHAEKFLTALREAVTRDQAAVSLNDVNLDTALLASTYDYYTSLGSECFSGLFNRNMSNINYNNPNLHMEAGPSTSLNRRQIFGYQSIGKEDR